jgi:hypothetical protein
MVRMENLDGWNLSPPDKKCHTLRILIELDGETNLD